ncbi:MAG: ABC transporter ATP-binding protein [Rhizobacter sp.]|nr:ABC transporter ATP-binding protein [Chlorobiales bacterium]
MKFYFRILLYLAPAKYQIVLAVIVSFITSIFSVFSIYTILPLLDTIFSAKSPAPLVKSAPPISPADSLAAKINPADPFGDVKASLSRFTASLTSGFQSVMRADTREQMLFNVCVFLIVVFILKNFFDYLNRQLVGRIESKTAKKLRDDVFSKMMTLSIDFYHKNRVGNLMDYVNNQVGVVHSTIGSSFMNFVRNPLIVIFFIACMLYISWQLTFFAFGVSILSLMIIRTVGKKVRKEADELQSNMGDMNSLLQEVFSGIKVVKSYATEEYESNRFRSFTDLLRRANLKISSIREISGPLNETLGISAIACVLWFGGLQVFSGAMTQSQLIFFVFALFSVMGPIKTMAETNTRIQEGLGAATRLFAILDAVPSVGNGTVQITNVNHSIVFDRVWFKYTDEYVLKDVSFALKKGEMTALVGASGSGKSTLVDLVLRFYDVAQGRITIDGTDIKEFDVASLRRMFGVVSQEVVLFNDTIANNIAYGLKGGVRFEHVKAAAGIANADEFILRTPEKYETNIGDRGTRLSGGQRQRLSIARAMLKNPPVLIFDEATSALDNESEKVVQAAIENAMTDRTSVVIAHRLSTIKNADKIIVMQAGEVAEQGTHFELLAQGGIYKKLYEMQFAAEPNGEPDRRDVSSDAVASLGVK